MKKINIPRRLPKSLKGLQSMIDYINSKYTTKKLTILEIGSWVGVSTELFAKAFRYVTAVDPWSATVGINTKYNMKLVEKEFDKRMKKYDNVDTNKMTSKEFASFTKDEFHLTGFDVIYIDGAHDYYNVKLDISLWKDRATKFICGHDYCNKFPGVKKAVNEAFGKPDKVFSDSSWLVKVK